MKTKNFIKNRGIILPVVLIFFSVLMLLGVTFVTVSGFQVTQSMNQVNRSKSFYLAKSGADTFSNHIKQASENLSYSDMKEVLDGIENKQSDIVYIDEGNLRIDVNMVTEQGKSYINILSSAEYKGIKSESTAKLLLSENSTSVSAIVPNLSGLAVVIVENETNGAVSIKKNASISGSIIYGTKNAYPNPVFPDEYQLDVKSNIILNGSSANITENGYYDLIQMDKHSTLNFDLKNQPMIIRVKKLVVNGDVNLINSSGQGELFLFVEDELIIGSQNKVVINNNGDPNKLAIFYNGSDSIIGKNWIKFNGLLYVPNAEVDLSTQSDIKGSIVAHTLIVSNQVSITSSSTSYVIPEEIIGISEQFIDISFDEYPWN